MKVPRTIKVLIKKKYKASRKLKEAIAHEDILKAKGEIVKLDNKIKLFYDNARAEEEEKVLDNIKDDQKSFFYKYFNNRKVTKSAIGPLLDPATGEYTLDKKRISELLSIQYASVFSVPLKEYANLSKDDFRNTPEKPTISDILFRGKEVDEDILKLRKGAAGVLTDFL